MIYIRCLHQSCTTNILPHDVSVADPDLQIRGGGGGGRGKFLGGHPEPEKARRGQSPPLCLTCTTLQSVLSRTAPRVCRINVQLFHVPKRVMNGYSKG